MCDLSIEVLVDDVVEFIFDQLEKKDNEFRTQAADQNDYERFFKKWLSETLCHLAEKCEDFGAYRTGGTEVAEAVVAEAVEELNCHQKQAILDRKRKQHEKIRELAERLFVAMVGGPGWHGMAYENARAAWIQAEAMIDFAEEQEPDE
jgi:hypothetical protein